MPFPFQYVCKLLQQLDEDSRSPKRKKDSSRVIIDAWFRQHRILLDAPTVDGCAILSALLPTRRTDRVYAIKGARLQHIVGKALVLGCSRVQELRSYLLPGSPFDLADCIGNVLTRTPNPVRPDDEVTVEEVDAVLLAVAAGCRFSSPAIRATKINASLSQKNPNELLGDLYCRLTPSEAKWLTRLVLRDYRPIELDERVIFRSYHKLLPLMLKVRDHLPTAVNLVRRITLPAEPNVIAGFLKPALGTKVGRQTWLKGRSIKNCLDLVGRKQISCEQKIDGEYCQIHIDLRNKGRPIQIFSKSGKDSTQDRKRLHGVIRESLRLQKPDCPFRLGCILEGELVVYSSKDDRILPFHYIRKHVSRSGTYIGTQNDSQRHDYEQLMIVYYDVLLIDNESLLNQRQSQRFKRLEQLICIEKGKAELVQRQAISLSRSDGVAQLREAFARCIVARDEGLVLKSDEPYFDFSSEAPKPTCVVKLKKAYFKGWGDVGDLAVIGASFDAAAARAHKAPNLKWTHFFLGCLQNREHILASGEQPEFMVTNVVELPDALLRTITTHCFPDPVKFDSSSAFKLDFSAIGNAQKPADIFEKPLVFEMMCFSFDKESNSRLWSMRFPSVSKIQHDRKFLDAMTFAEFQRAAHLATEAPDPEDSQEMRHWIKALEQTGPLEGPADASSQECFSTQASLTSMLSAPSPKRGRSGGGIAPQSLPTITEHTAAGSTDVVSIVIERVPMTPPTSLDRDALQPQLQPQLHRKRVTDSPLHASNTGKRRRPLGPVNLNVALAPSESDSKVVPTILRPPALAPANPEPPLSEERHVRGVIDLESRPDAGSFCSAEDMLSSSPCFEDASQFTASGCSLQPSACALPNCAILLAPCIANYHWLTDNLLRAHGIVDFAVEPETWAQKLAMWRKKPRRKICLVEGQRQEATNAFLERITKAGIRTASGAHEWTEVYDWRLLEDLTARESGTKPRGVDPWYKWRLGLV